MPSKLSPFEQCMIPCEQNLSKHSDSDKAPFVAGDIRGAVVDAMLTCTQMMDCDVDAFAAMSAHEQCRQGKSAKEADEDMYACVRAAMKYGKKEHYLKVVQSGPRISAQFSTIGSKPKLASGCNLDIQINCKALETGLKLKKDTRPEKCLNYITENVLYLMPFGIIRNTGRRHLCKVDQYFATIINSGLFRFTRIYDKINTSLHFRFMLASY